MWIELWDDFQDRALEAAKTKDSSTPATDTEKE